jgi:hypothetical protein
MLRSNVGGPATTSNPSSTQKRLIPISANVFSVNVTDHYIENDAHGIQQTAVGLAAAAAALLGSSMLSC